MLAKEQSTRCINSVHSRAELHDVEIDFQNAALRPCELYEHGEIGFESLAKQAPAGPKVQVLGKLLGDCAGPAWVLAIFPERLRERLKVESMMVRELLVFGRNDGDGKSEGNLIQGNPPLVDTAFMVQPVLKDEGGRGGCKPTPGKGQRHADKHYDPERRCGVPPETPPAQSVTTCHHVY